MSTPQIMDKNGLLKLTFAGNFFFRRIGGFRGFPKPFFYEKKTLADKMMKLTTSSFVAEYCRNQRIAIIKELKGGGGNGLPPPPCNHQRKVFYMFHRFPLNFPWLGFVQFLKLKNRSDIFYLASTPFSPRDGRINSIQV